MIFLNILGIIARIVYGLNVIGFFLGMFLHEKYPIFEEIFSITGFFAVLYGITHMFVFAILGT
jgi:hypothetical protein